MMSMLRKALGAAALATLLFAASASQAAAAVISLSPSAPVVGLNQAFSVDVIVSGLDGTAAQAVAGFDFTVNFNNTLAVGTGYTADPAGKMGPGIIDLSDPAFTTSPFLAFVSSDVPPLGTVTGAQLAGLQGTTPFTLMHLNFLSKTTEGLLTISLANPALSNAAGAGIGVQAGTATICIDGSPTDEVNACAVTAPEPGLLSLLGAGLATVGMRMRRRRS
jgi:hypothetical protein